MIAERLAQIQAHIAEGLRVWRYQQSAGAADTILGQDQITRAQNDRLERAEHMVRDLRDQIAAVTLVREVVETDYSGLNSVRRTESVDVALFFPERMEEPTGYMTVGEWRVAQPALIRSDKKQFAEPSRALTPAQSAALTKDLESADLMTEAELLERERGLSDQHSAKEGE